MKVEQATSPYRAEAERQADELIAASVLSHLKNCDIREIMVLMLCQAYHSGGVAAMDKAISRMKAVQ